MKRVHVINFILDSVFFRLTRCVNSGKSGIVPTDINWYEWIPIDQPSILFEFVLDVEFPASACYSSPETKSYQSMCGT